MQNVCVSRQVLGITGERSPVNLFAHHKKLIELEKHLDEN